MSCNRENVTWKSRDGKWNIGFFECYPTGDQSSEDWDSEWDVDYDYDTFMWASTGHSSEDAAYQAWDGANPGGTTVYEEPCEQTDRYDEMAATWKAAQPPRARPLRPLVNGRHMVGHW